MSVLAYILGVLLIALGISVSIALHEIGHLLPAKRFGVKCTQYMVGFGPTIWSRRHGETEYGIKAIPLGGYVRMIGMFPPRSARRSGRTEQPGRLATMIEDARSESLAEIAPGEEGRAFYRLGTLPKIAVMLGGPVMNLLIATVIFAFLVPLHGMAVPGDGAQVGAVSQCVRPVSGDPAADRRPCTPADRVAPAAAAGLRPGDTIVSIDGERVDAPEDVGRLVRGHAGRPLPVVVDREGQTLDLSITPIANTVPQLDGHGRPVTDAAGKVVTTTAGFIGTSTGFPLVRYDTLADVPGFVWYLTERTGRVVLTLPQRLVDVWQAAFGTAERDENGPMSVVGVGRVAGEVSSGSMTDSHGAPVQFSLADKAITLWMLLAGLNIALFVFNLIPLLPLDGGHVAGALWEAARRGVARLLHRPDPGYVDVAKALPLTYAMSVVLIGMSVLLIYADIVKPVRL